MMATTHPHLALEFHPTKNAPLTPQTVGAWTKKPFWWKCKNLACGHEWMATGATRARGYGCPMCAGRVREQPQV